MVSKIARIDVITKLSVLAESIGPIAAHTEWHLFGSVDRNEPFPADIDLMILCSTDIQADNLRQAIDSDLFDPPLHLSLFTFEEARSIDVTCVQNSKVIFRLDSDGRCQNNI